SEHGDLDLYWRKLISGEEGHYELYDQFESDDHAVAALWSRPDGRTAAVFARHGSHPDTYSRLSAIGDPRKWDKSLIFKAVMPTEYVGRENYNVNPTYTNLLTVGIGKSRRLLNFTRSVGWNPNFLTSSDYGNTWKYGGRLMNSAGRPYLKYTNNLEGSLIHFSATEQHPRDFDNSIYHGVTDGSVLRSSNGNILDDDLTDQDAIEPTDLTLVYKGGAENVAWTVDMEMDQDDHPVIAFSVQKNSAGMPVGQGGTDHRYHYARFDGTEWTQSEIAFAGTRLYSREDDYTGLMALDPQNVSQMVISTNADPDTGEPLISNADGKRHYEIFEGISKDQGENWIWSALTYNSNVDNIRPVIPNWHSDQRVVLWMRGTYITYTDFDTQLVGIIQKR
ncbi:MAG: hypothetical protein HOM01_06580, partial [Kordiimonadaceae bacterium]|nr:hypothetical protein [Kordiimonadaceae bacterium]